MNENKRSYGFPKDLDFLSPKFNIISLKPSEVNECQPLICIMSKYKQVLSYIFFTEKNIEKVTIILFPFEYEHQLN